ncbi:hypothetical protein NE1135 [Nitrosomonas europaea ATCC 19718]|uniref:Uncharacterized protein n=1 Tax=Nitrosomonas europaea (strain ATCC 19718 / CIP 103999 / KCTC 2705 / NBRC 14298) TaxID=228410 RepID=Q82VF5_NITEU|nr:hypothetical protein NE1135 [Nitrosomonas europaea ATCC 19718]
MIEKYRIKKPPERAVRIFESYLSQFLLSFSALSTLSGMESRSIDMLGGYWAGFGSPQAVKKVVTASAAANTSESFIFSSPIN